MSRHNLLHLYKLVGNTLSKKDGSGRIVSSLGHFGEGESLGTSIGTYERKSS